MEQATIKKILKFNDPSKKHIYFGVSQRIHDIREKSPKIKESAARQFLRNILPK